MHAVTTLTGSALLALALLRGRLSAEEAWTAAHVDEDPPVIPTFDQRFSSQSNPANAYDVYGRRWLLGFRYRL